MLEQAALMTDDLVLGARHLALDAAPASPGAAPAELAVPAVASPPRRTRLDAARKPLPQAIAELEMRAIREALSATGGNKLAAAKLLGISRATLYDKLGAADDAAQ